MGRHLADHFGVMVVLLQAPVSIAVAAEHVRHFWGAAGHWPGHQVRAGTMSARADACKKSSGLAVAHTLLVARRRYRAVVLRLR